MATASILLGCGPTVPSVTGSGSASSSAGTSGSGGGSASVTGSPPSDTTSAPPSSTSTGPRTDLPGDDTGCLEWASLGCAELLPVTAPIMETPLGTFELEHWAFGGLAGCGSCIGGANIISIFGVADPEDITSPVPDPGYDAVEIRFGEDTPFEGPLGRPIPVRVQVFRDGMSATHQEATVVIDVLPGPEDLAEPFDPAAAFVVTGTLSFSEPGWSSTGSFAASYCPMLNEYFICE